MVAHLFDEPLETSSMDEESLVSEYMEITGCTETEARAVFMLVPAEASAAA
jgi:hypothetical protein